MKKDLTDLLLVSSIQTRVVSLLKAMGLIEGTNYHNASLTDKARGMIKADLISEDKVRDFMDLFPPGHRSNVGLVQSKMTRFLKEHPKYDYGDIYDAAIRWVEAKGDYCGDAKYFFYKKTTDGEFSRCLEVLETIKHSGNVI